MRSLILALALLPTVAFAKAPVPDPVVVLARNIDAECRGSYLEPAALDKICKLRDQAFEVLEASGYCFGKKGQVAGEMEWHRCGRGSIRAGD